MSRVKAYHAVTVKDPNKPRTYFASCIVEMPDGSIQRLYQYGTSELGAVVALQNLVYWQYGASISDETSVPVNIVAPSAPVGGLAGEVMGVMKDKAI